MHTRRHGWLIRGLTAVSAALALYALLWLPWRTQAGRAVAWEAPSAWAASVISGTITWKGTDTPVDGVRVVLRDAQARALLGETTTDATGLYYLSAGVGDWVVDVPSTSHYWGYTQVMTAYPHQDYHLDFGITVRPPEPAPGVVQAAAPLHPVAPQVVPAGPALPPQSVSPPVAPVVQPSPLPSVAVSAPSVAAPTKLPLAGRPAGWWLTILAAIALVGIGRLVRGRTTEGTHV